MLFLWLECLFFIARHDDVSTTMICSQEGEWQGGIVLGWMGTRGVLIYFGYMLAYSHFGGFIMFLIG